MKLNENSKLRLRLQNVNMKNYAGIVTLDARVIIDALHEDDAIKKALAKLAE